MRNYWNLRLSDFAILFFSVSALSASAQFSDPEVDLPNEERYLYPVNPGQPGSLAGTMGELRTTHFHSGIDIRTNNMVGFPVLASKSGYVSRVSMSGSGYGNVIYITHPDGYTTLYAHLLEFKGALREYVLKEQYRRKTFDIDLFFRENQFSIKQGDTIALSGNTGSSGGPHLHFDIRDPNNLAVDPLKFGFSEIIDVTPPAAEKIALRTLDINSRINDRFGRFEFYAFRVGNSYVINTPILAYGNIGVELLAKDKFGPKSRFYGGVNFITMQVDSQLVFSQSIEKLNLTETRRIYTLMDFKTLRNRGSRFYKLYIDDGNILDFYNTSPTSGKIRVTEGKDSPVRIQMKDIHGNSSVLSFTLKPSLPVKEVMTLETMKSPLDVDISENTMVITVKPCIHTEHQNAVVYKNGNSATLEPAYFNISKRVYLIDLRKEIPDSVVACEQSVVPYIKDVVPSGTEYTFYSDIADITFPDDALYDTLYLSTAHQVLGIGSEVFHIGDPTFPLNRSVKVSLQPQQAYTWNQQTAVYRLAGKGYAYVGGELQNGRVLFYTREFGSFTIMNDLTPPTIKPVYVTNQSVRFRISDDLSGISTYEAKVNGKWLLMHYDAKSASIWSQRLDKIAPLKGEFELIVTDRAGNKQAYTQKIP